MAQLTGMAGIDNTMQHNSEPHHPMPPAVGMGMHMGMQVNMRMLLKIGLHILQASRLQVQWWHHTQDVHRACTRIDVESVDAGGRERALESEMVSLHGQ